MNGLSLLLVLFAFPLLSHGAEHKLRVLSTFLPIYCFTANVAGDLAEVENLVGNGISLHDYQLNPSDLLKIQRADIVFINGLGSDAFIEKAFQAEKKQKVIVVSKGFKSELIRDGGTVNPHIWLDPQLATRMVTNILIGLQGADPLHAADYEANAQLYLSKLNALDAEISKKVASVRGVAFLTYHNAFPYFTRHYGLNLVGVVEETPEVSPTPRELSKIHAIIRKEHAKALFTSPETPLRLARQIAQDSGMKLAELDPLESGPLIPSQYENGMRANTDRLVKTLE